MEKSTSFLISYNSIPSSLDSLMPDNGLINLASSLTQAGHKTKIFDYSTVSHIKEVFTDEIHNELIKAYNKLNERNNLQNSLKRFKEINLVISQRKADVLKNSIIKKLLLEIENAKPDFVGFKLWTGEGFVGSIEIAEAIKAKHPEIKIIGGGPHNDYFYERTFEFTEIFDVLAYGEGEETIIDLAEWSIQKKELIDIKNIIYKTNGKPVINAIKRVENLDLHAVPLYDLDIYPALKGNDKINIIMIDESRGCPNCCNFCPHPKKSGKKWRKRSPENIIKIFKDASEKCNTNCFRLAGSNPPAELIEEICKKILEHKLKIQFVSFGYARNSSAKFYSLLKEAGCYSILFGIESGNPDILKHTMNKKTTVEKMKEAISLCKNAGIKATASLIVPAPGETMQSFLDTQKLCIDLGIDGISLCMPGVIPGSEWFEKKEKYNIELDADYYSKMMTYTIRFLMPPPLWETLPYKIDGRNFYEMMVITDILNTYLEKNGINTGINEITLLFADKLNYSNSEMRDVNRNIFVTGNFNKIEELVTKFNKEVSLT